MGPCYFYVCFFVNNQFPYPFGADCRGQRQSRSGFRRQLEANRQNGGHFGYMGPTRVPESHLGRSSNSLWPPQLKSRLGTPKGKLRRSHSAGPTAFSCFQARLKFTNRFPVEAANGFVSKYCTPKVKWFIIIHHRFSINTAIFRVIPHFWTGPNSRVSPDRRSSSSCRRPQRSSCRVRSASGSEGIDRVIDALSEVRVQQLMDGTLDLS